MGPSTISPGLSKRHGARSKLSAFGLCFESIGHEVANLAFTTGTMRSATGVQHNHLLGEACKRNIYIYK